MIINNMLISILILLFINNDINRLCFDEMSSSNILFCNPNPSWMRWRSLKSSFVGKFHIPRWSKILFQLFCINSRARVPATIVLNEYSQFCFWINILVLGLNWILNSLQHFCINSKGRVKVPVSWRETKLLHIITISSRPLQTWVTLQNKFPLLWGKSCRYLGAKRPTQFERDWILKLWHVMLF